MKGITYQQFLETPFWQAIRVECYQRDGYKCQNCQAASRLRAHHRFYRPNWFETRLADLVTLCEDCHTKVHAGQLPQFMGRVRVFDWRGNLLRTKRPWFSKSQKKKRAKRRAMARKFGWSF